MADTPAEVLDFLHELAHRAKPYAEKDMAELREFAARELGLPDLQAWDISLTSEKLREARYAYSDQEVKQYLQEPKVLAGLFRVIETLYGLDIRPDQAPVWHDDVKFFALTDKRGQLVGQFYLDLYARETKRGGAWMDDAITRRRKDEGVQTPVAYLTCNFTRPVGGKPALLTHREVETIFHEFGHLLHHLFAGRQRYLSFSGIATEWDFVEAPSQMYEEWAWDAGVLARFARHHRSGASIPPELVAKLRAAEEYGKGTHVSVQMFYAALSLALHDRDPAGLDPMALLVELKRERLPFPHEPGSHFVAAFGHLHGYSAIYYTYMWSLVIAKDLFSRFDGDLMNSATANEYRRAILAPGGSRDAAELVRAFLGRDYATDAWEAWLNR
jgi:oligopeptidase A